MSESPTLKGGARGSIQQLVIGRLDFLHFAALVLRPSGSNGEDSSR